MTMIFRICLFITLFLAATALVDKRISTAADGVLVSRSAAEGHGLTRAWFSQARLDPGRGRVSHVTLVEKSENHPDTLFVQTDRAGLHVFDAQSGETLWVKKVGPAAYPSLPLGVNEKMVAVVNGTNLYVLSRTDGKILWTGRISGVPTAGVTMSKRRVFVPTMSGKVIGYLLKQIAEEPVLPEAGKGKPENEDSAERKKTESPGAAEPESLRLKQGLLTEVSCGSSGTINTRPLIVRDDELGAYIAWTTSKGMFMAHIDRQDEHHFPLLYELAGQNEIAARPAYLPPKPDNPAQEGVIFVASVDGTVYAYSERHGTELWRRATGRPIVETVVALDGQVFVASALGGMYCLDASSGVPNWTAPHIMKFVAASPTRIYAADRFDRLLVLDAKSGDRIDTLPFSAPEFTLCNTLTDRIYLISKTGLIQCLHETELTQPFRHLIKEKAKPDAEKKDGPEKKPVEKEEKKAPGGESEGQSNPFG